MQKTCCGWGKNGRKLGAGQKREETWRGKDERYGLLVSGNGVKGLVERRDKGLEGHISHGIGKKEICICCRERRLV